MPFVSTAAIAVWDILFQNRYKSILCQADSYFLELVRYIHLNPLRGNQVATMDELENYKYSGHSTLMGYHDHAWQKTDAVLSEFGKRVQTARKAYRSFVEKGISLGKTSGVNWRRTDSEHGRLECSQVIGPIESAFKGDERILGDSDFVELVLAKQNERLERHYALRAQGYDFKKL